MKIVIGQDSTVQVALTLKGSPVNVSAATSIVGTIYNYKTGKALSVGIAANSADIGAGWAGGVVVLVIPADQTLALPDIGVRLRIVVTSSSGTQFHQDVAVAVEAATDGISSLFIKELVVADIRADQLVMSAGSIFPSVKVSDDYIWRQVRSAESALSHTLRVKFEPTAFFPSQPSADELAALPNGMPWAIDPGYDFEPDFFSPDKWGFIKTRDKPLISVTSIRFAYPSSVKNFYDIPHEWVRFDPKYGHIRLVPTSGGYTAPMMVYMRQAIGGGSSVPFMIEVRYIAGLTDIPKNYPEILEAVKKMAVLKMLQDAYLPQSGSISADGLSQSVSVDMDKYHSNVDRMINGANGNGGLMAAIHGIRMAVM